MVTSDGRRKEVNDCYALKSTPCIPKELARPDVSDEVAVIGRQPRHWDVPDQPSGECLKDLELPATDVPLSVMVAIEPGAKLWIYPEGCDSSEDTALLVNLEVGDVLVWRGDLVHAGAGYGVEHYRIHAYIDSPFFYREKGTGRCLRRALFGNARAEAAADMQAKSLARDKTLRAKAAADAKAAVDAKAAEAKARRRQAPGVQDKAKAVLLAKEAALRRRVSYPQSPASSGGPASAHSSPSLQPDELSDGFNSEDEQPFNTASPLGVMDWPDDEDDDGEAAFAARLEAHDEMQHMDNGPDAGQHNVLGDGNDDVLHDVEPYQGEPGHNGEPSEGEQEAAAAASAAPDPSKPPKLGSKTALLRASACAWPKSAVFVLLSVVSNGLPSAPRMLSLAAEVADPHSLLSGTTSEPFHQYVRLADGQPVNPDSTRSIHGYTFEELQQRAGKGVAEVGQDWVDWLQQVMSRAPQSTPFVLAAWNGYKKGAFSLLCTELQRHGLSLSPQLQVIDVADLVSSKKLFGSATHLPAIAALSLRDSTPRLQATATGACAVTAVAALGDLSAAVLRTASAEPKLLSLVVHELTSRTARAGKVVDRAGCALPLTPFWKYGGDVAAHEAHLLHDPEPGPWQAGPPPCEQAFGLDFCAREGCKPKGDPPEGRTEHGGPSAALLAAVGLDGDGDPQLTAPAVETSNGDPNETARKLMLDIFHFFFPEPAEVDAGEVESNVLQRIVDATNEKAAELVVREQPRGRFRAATLDDPDDSLEDVKSGPHARHRAPEMVTEPLTVNELLVYLGIRILLGAYNPDVIDYPWSSTECWRVPSIADSMRLDRFKLINSHLSFMLADDNSNREGPFAKLRKIYDVSEWLRDACQRAWDPEPDAVPDESRLRLSSRYCSFATTLLCKPIKHGLTIYCLNFCRTRYLYNFEWFCGREADHGRGQPTDTTALNEDNPEEMKYMMGLMDRLISPELNDTGMAVYTDKAFTSMKLARLLAKRRIAIVGMLRTAGRPKNRPNGDGHYWPFRHYSKAELDAHTKGYQREAHVALEAGDIKWLKAELWRDAKWVTLISTSFFSAARHEVRRWDKSKGDRMPVKCSLALKRYNKFMGAVDQFNKELAKTHMQMGRCKQRFHRSLFLGWLLPAVGVVNVRTAFCEIVKEKWGAAVLKKLKKARGVGTTTFPKWFQLRLGELLIEKGVQKVRPQGRATIPQPHAPPAIAAATCISHVSSPCCQATETNNGEEPHFKPTRTTHHWERRFVLPTPPGYAVNHPKREAVDLAKKPCKIPIAWDSKSGKATGWLGGGPDRKHSGGRCELCCIRASREGLPRGENSRWSRFACKHCRVILCDGCWDLWDHENECAPRDLPPAAAGKSKPDTTPSNSEPFGPELPAAPRCPEGHLMNDNTFDGSGLKCDGCDNALGTIFFSCCVDECDYDLCLQCSKKAPATMLSPSTDKRAERVNAREKPSLPAPLRRKPQRTKSKEALKRAASAGRKQVEKQRTAKEERLRKMNAARHRHTKQRDQPTGCKRKRSRSRH